VTSSNPMNNILQISEVHALAAIFILLTAINVFSYIYRLQHQLSSYIRYIWFYFLIFLVAETISFYIATWLWGILSFFVLREFFSLIDFRLQDRFGVVAAYLSIPFMMHFIHTDWYNLFIITIPVYSFLIIPFLVAIGGKEAEGAINSIAVIIFGLFLFVYCIGHIAYLSYYNIWMASVLILNIVIFDMSAFVIERRVESTLRRVLYSYIIPVPFTIVLTLSLAEWCALPQFHAIILGTIIPAIIIIGNFSLKYLASDLGIVKDNLHPGRGVIIYNIKSILYAAPVVLHYYRYFIGG
jgi:phosphatidate cytidylyltransferase